MKTEEYLHLVELLQRYNYEYYTLDQSTVADDVYDGLMRQVKEFESRHPERTASFSPTQRVGGPLSGGFRKVRHSRPMLSLNDCFSMSEVRQWRERLCKLAETRPDRPEQWSYFVDIKMDGLALAVIYEDGCFVRAVTRGDGRVGEDVTDNAKTIRNLPLRLPALAGIPETASGRLEVRGEVILFKRDFEAINRQNQKAGEALYANPRNLAAGTMRQLDARLVANRRLVFRAYDIVGGDYATHLEVYETMAKLHFSHNHQFRACRNLFEVEKEIIALESEREHLPFDSDGLVIKVDSRDIFDRFGNVSKSPRGALAYKYPPEQTTAVVEDIVLQVGRTGAVTPVAVLKPVSLAGTTVTHASLHNADEIGRLDVRRRDTVVIFKAGDIIPKVSRVIRELRPKRAPRFNFVRELRKQYPGRRFERLPDEVAYKLVRSSGGDENLLLVLALRHYAARGAVDIVGLGEANSRALVEAGLVKNVADIYFLRLEQLLPLEGFAQLSAQNLIKAIAARKRPPLSKFIFGLGLPSVGEQLASDLAGHFKTWARFARAKREDLESLDGFGPKTAESIIACFADPRYSALFARFAAAGVKPAAYKPAGGPLSGQRLVITGTLAAAGRLQAQRLIAEAGGQLQAQVMAHTDYLVVGAKPGTNKIEAAKRQGVKMLTENQFLSILRR